MQWSKEVQLKDWIELMEKYGPTLWKWIGNRFSAFVEEASEEIEKLMISHMPDRFTLLKDECRPQYINHFENEVTYQMESGWLVYGLPTIERWLVQAGGEFGNLTVQQERQILKWRKRQAQRRVNGYGRSEA